MLVDFVAKKNSIHQRQALQVLLFHTIAKEVKNIRNARFFGPSDLAGEPSKRVNQYQPVNDQYTKELLITNHHHSPVSTVIVTPGHTRVPTKWVATSHRSHRLFPSHSPARRCSRRKGCLARNKDSVPYKGNIQQWLSGINY